MPNWTETELVVVLPSRNAEKFKGYFLSHNSEENKEKNRYFGRTFLDDFNEEKNQHGMSCLRISCECAWSVSSCMIEGYPDDKEKGIYCMTLAEACKECEVSRLRALSTEPGIGFQESVTYDKDDDGKVNYESRDTYPDPWCEYVDENEVDEKAVEPEMN